MLSVLPDLVSRWALLLIVTAEKDLGAEKKWICFAMGVLLFSVLHTILLQSPEGRKKIMKKEWEMSFYALTHYSSYFKYTYTQQVFVKKNICNRSGVGKEIILRSASWRREVS